MVHLTAGISRGAHKATSAGIFPRFSRHVKFYAAVRS